MWMKSDRTTGGLDAAAAPLLSLGLMLALSLTVLPASSAQTVMSADGMIESTAGGFIFPDGSIQDSAVASALTPIESVPYIIDAPGSYYLTGSLTIDSGIAITVDSSDVTLDLMGHTLDGLDSAQHGVEITAGFQSIDIQNGALTRFTSDGLDGNIAGAVRVTNVRVVDNGIAGIRLNGDGGEVTRCTARGNGGQGLSVSDGGIVRGSVSSGNLAGITSFGVGAAFVGNLVEDNTNNGIKCSEECTILDNTVSGNNKAISAFFAGIRVEGNDTLVRGNHVTANMEHNILVSGSGNLIEGNLITESSIGVTFDATAGDNATANNRSSNHSIADFQNNGTGAVAALDNLAF